MPIYEYKCGDCNKITTHINTIDNRHNTPPCSICEGITKLIISLSDFNMPAPRVIKKTLGEYDDNNEYITD